MKNEYLTYQEEIEGILWRCYTYFEPQLNRYATKIQSRILSEDKTLNQSMLSVTHPCFHWHNYLMDKYFGVDANNWLEPDLLTKIFADLTEGRRLSLQIRRVSDQSLRVILTALANNPTLVYHVEQESTGTYTVVICREEVLGTFISAEELTQLFTAMIEGTQFPNQGIAHLSATAMSEDMTNQTVFDLVRLFVLTEPESFPKSVTFQVEGGTRLIESQATTEDEDLLFQIDGHAHYSLRELLLGYPPQLAIR